MNIFNLPPLERAVRDWGPEEPIGKIYFNFRSGTWMPFLLGSGIGVAVLFKRGSAPF